MKQHNLFGTDGIRAAVGSEPFNLRELIKLGKAIACWARERYGTSPVFLLGHDTRVSCSLVKAALQSGLLLYPITIYDAQILSTPALCALTQHGDRFDCGIIISASHNPYHDNGIKIVTRLGKINLEDEQRITQLYHEQTIAHQDYSSLGTTVLWPTAEQEYINAILGHFPTNFLFGKKIVLDCANGATSWLAPRIFQQLGAHTIVIHNQPNGTNINQNCGALHLNDLAQAVVAHRAAIGFAFDGDGDRVIAVNHAGEIKNGDDLLALLLGHPSYASTPAIVGTIMSNQGFEQYIRGQNKLLLRTAVGDKYVADKLAKENLLIGGEQSGHIILRDYLDTGDAIFTALRILEAVMHSGNWAMQTFTRHPQILLNIRVGIKKDLAHPTIVALIDQSKARLQSGRVIVRYSGTENVLRIMIEDNELDHIQKIGSLLSQALQEELAA